MMSQIVALPKTLENTLDALIAVNQESNGVIWTKRKGRINVCTSIFMTGIGDDSHVEANEERIRLVNVFLEKNPQYCFVKFHTHTYATIQKHGEYYAEHFSTGDIQGYQEQLQHNPDFLAMVVTPVKKLLYGRDNPELVVIADPKNFLQESAIIDLSVRIMARFLNINLDNFSAKKKK